MTRSVEIPEEGGLRGLYDDTRRLSIRGSINHEVAVKLGDEEAFFTWADLLLAAATQAAIEANSLPPVHPRHHDHINARDAADCDACNSPALPYLAPACQGDGVCTNPRCPTHGIEWDAPAGDGGLREALEKLASEIDTGSRATVNREAKGWQERAARRLRDVLAAHPAAPAVPQPVDREALREQIGRAIGKALVRVDAGRLYELPHLGTM